MPKEKLLPLTPNSRPIAFTLKLSQDVQKQLSSLKCQNIKIVVINSQLHLKINDRLFKLNRLPEYSKVDIYKQLSSSTFKNIGAIDSKLNVTNETKPTESSSNSSRSSSSTPVLNGNAHHRNRSNGSNTLIASGTKISAISKRLIHLLALGPITIKEMAKRTKLQTSDIESVLKSVSMEYNPELQTVITKYPKPITMDGKLQEKYYVLNYSSYKELKANDWKYSLNEVKQIKDNCVSVFDYLKYPSSHPARTALKTETKLDTNTDTKLDTKHSPVPPSTQPSISEASETHDKPIPDVKEPKPKSRIIPKTEASSISKRDPSSKVKSINSAKPKSEATSEVKQNVRAEIKKRKRESPSTENQEYLNQLAERFKSTYKEYEALHKELSYAKNKNAQKLKKLVELHHNLELWKKKLWNSVQH